MTYQKELLRFCIISSFVPSLFHYKFFIASYSLLSLILVLQDKGRLFILFKNKAILALLALFLFQLYYNNNKELLLIGLCLYILPLTPWFLIGNDLIHFKEMIYESYNLGVILLVSSILLQCFISPNLWGLVQHYSYNEQTIGTTSFRAIGLAGSPQNTALYLGLGLLTSLPKKYIQNILIILCGILTKSTFFGCSFLLYCYKILSPSLRIITLILSPFIILVSTENTPFEAFNFIEVSDILNTRYYGFSDCDFNLINLFIGKGFGSSTQGLVDRYVDDNNYAISESGIITVFYEFGISGLVLISILITLLALKIIKLIKTKQNCALILILILANFIVTPCLSGFRNKFLIAPFFLLPFLNLNKPAKKIYHHDN